MPPSTPTTPTIPTQQRSQDGVPTAVTRRAFRINFTEHQAADGPAHFRTARHPGSISGHLLSATNVHTDATAYTIKPVRPA